MIPVKHTTRSVCRPGFVQTALSYIDFKRRKHIGVAESLGQLRFGRLEGVEKFPDVMRLGELDLAPNQNRFQVFLHRLLAMKGDDVLKPVGLSPQVFSCVEILGRAVDPLEN